MSQGKKNTNPTKVSPNIILENLLDGVLIVDTYGYIIYANKAAEEMFKKRSSELVGQNFGYAITPYEIQEIELVHNKETVSVQLLAAIIKWNDKNVFLMTLRDVSEKKKLEEVIRKVHEQLKELNSELEDKVSTRTAELEKKNKELEAYSAQLKNTYEITEMKVKFRIAELEKELEKLTKQSERLKK